MYWSVGRAAASPAPLAQVGFAIKAAPPGDLGAALVGRATLYWWPTDGAPSRAYVSAGPSRTWWPILGRPRRCAARRTRCSTPPPTASAGCCSPPPPPQGSLATPRRGPGGGPRPPSESPTPAVTLVWLVGRNSLLCFPTRVARALLAWDPSLP